MTSSLQGEYGQVGSAPDWLGGGGVGPECEQVSALRPIRNVCIYVPPLWLVEKTGEQRERGRGDRHPRSPGTHPVTAWSGVMIYVQGTMFFWTERSK